MPQAKTLIEVALPLAAINRACENERSGFGHPSTLHLWWARRRLAATRAVVFSSLVEDPDDPNANPTFVEACKKLNYGATSEEIAALKAHAEKNRERRLRGQNATSFKRNIPQNARGDNDSPRMRLFDFIERLVEWEATTNENIMAKARELIHIATNGHSPSLLDPFAGGGSIPLEAQRLGLEAYASDLNPVAVMINKAMLEIPPRFAELLPVNPRDRKDVLAGKRTKWKGASGLVADLRYYGEWMREQAFERIGHLYPKINNQTVIAWFWVRTVACPNPTCGIEMPLASTLSLSTKSNNKAWVEPILADDADRFHFDVKTGDGTPPKAPKIGRGVNFRCLACGETASDNYIKAEGQAGRMSAQMIGIASEGHRRRNYHTVNDAHLRAANEAYPMWEPDFEMSTHPQYMAPPRYGMTRFSDLFSPRQTLALDTFSDLVPDVRKKVHADALAAGLSDNGVPLRLEGKGATAYAEAVTLYLALNVGRQANRLSTLCFWDTGSQKVQQVFSRQAYTMNWNFVEANPFSNSSGNFLGQLKYLTKVIERLGRNGYAQAMKSDAVTANYERKALYSTDPPYYDNVPYADLSDFFYVWLRKCMRSIYPDIFRTALVPKKDELVADHERLGGRDKAKEFFEDGLRKVFQQMENSTVDYPVTIYYAFKQTAGKKNTKGGRAEYSGWETVLKGLIESGFTIQRTWPMKTEQDENIKKNRNAISSSIVLVCRPRPVSAPNTTHRLFLNDLRAELPSAVAEMKSGNISPVDLPQASIGPGMAIYSRYSKVSKEDGTPLAVSNALDEINKALTLALEEPISGLDPASQWAAQWFELHGFTAGQFGAADNMARAKNISMDDATLTGVVKSAKGRVKLIYWKDYPKLYPERLWEPRPGSPATVWEGAHHLIHRLLGRPYIEVDDTRNWGEPGAAELLKKLPDDVVAAVHDLAYWLHNICQRNSWTDEALDYGELLISWSEISRLAASAGISGGQGQLPLA